MQQTMLMSNPNDVYRRQAIMTAGPLDLIIMLYEGLKKDLVLGQKAIIRKNPAAAHSYLIKAQNIITELINCLDLSFSLSKDLMALYDFMLRSIEEANLNKDAEIITPVIEMVETLKNTWQEIRSTQKGSMALKEG